MYVTFLIRGHYQVRQCEFSTPAKTVDVSATPHIKAAPYNIQDRRKRRFCSKKRGCLKREPLTVAERNRRAERARSWLRKTLDGGLTPAPEIIRLAHKAGVNEWALRRAKKWLGVMAVKAGGRRQGWGAKCF
jgi:hypothetical protein